VAFRLRSEQEVEHARLATFKAGSGSRMDKNQFYKSKFLEH